MTVRQLRTQSRMTAVASLQWPAPVPHVRCPALNQPPALRTYAIQTITRSRRGADAVLWIARTGAPWRDLPETFGNWNTVFRRFRHWVKLNVFKRIFDAVSDDPDMEFAMTDGTIVKAHRHGRGAKGELKAKP